MHEKGWYRGNGEEEEVLLEVKEEEGRVRSLGTSKTGDRRSEMRMKMKIKITESIRRCSIWKFK